MEKEFILYEQALELKELGFDECCFGYYDLDGLQISTHHWYPGNKNSMFPLPQETNNPKVSAPTFSQAFKFIREKYNLIGLVEGGYDNGKNIFTYVIWDDFRDNITDEYFKTYEEAELSCLIKLIEIVKTK